MSSSNFGQCVCGTRGDLTLLSPRLLEGGNTRHARYRVTNQNEQSHEFDSDWSDDEQRYVTTCLK